MILPKKQLPAEWPEGWDEETNQLADMCESVASDTDWLDGIEDEGLLPVLPETLPDHDAPLVASFWLEHLADQQQLHDRAVMTECEGPHAGVWRYLESIESEIGRLTQACRASTGLERESNLRQLREAEQDRSALTRSHEFCEALRHRIEFTDSQIARCPNPTPEQQTAARWWGGIRTDWMRLTESLLVESRRSTVDRSDDETAPAADTKVERGHCQPEAMIRTTDGEARRLGNALAHAMDAGLIAYRKLRGTTPTARALFYWLGEYDKTGIIVGVDEATDKITWKRADGGLKDTAFKSFQNRFTGLIRK